MTTWLIRTDVPFRGNSQSFLTDEGKVAYTNNLTVEEYEKERGYKVKLVSNEEFEVMLDEFYAGMVSAPVGITEEDYWDALECLPPCRWTKGKGVEFFFVSERVADNLVNWYALSGGKYFTFVDYDNKTDEEIREKVEKAL